MAARHQRPQAIPATLLDRRHGIANPFVFRHHVGDPLVQHPSSFNRASWSGLTSRSEFTPSNALARSHSARLWA